MRKRVHELAKELKRHDIMLDNKALVTKLAALGFDVKSPMSSLSDAEAEAALHRILDEFRHRTTARPSSAARELQRAFKAPSSPPPAAPAGATSSAAGPRYHMRVWEVARALKQQGLELDNREVVAELVALGYDVKSHSSSLPDVQGAAAIQRILDRRRQRGLPQPAEPERLQSPHSDDRAPTVAATSSQGASGVALSAAQQPAASPSRIFIDASNVCREGKRAFLARLHSARRELGARYPHAKLRFVADANLRNHLSPEEQAEFEQLLQSRSIEQGPSQREADSILFRYLRKYPDAWLVSNDNFKQGLDSGEAPADLPRRQLRFQIDFEDNDFLLLPEGPPSSRGSGLPRDPRRPKPRR